MEVESLKPIEVNLEKMKDAITRNSKQESAPNTKISNGISHEMDSDLRPSKKKKIEALADASEKNSNSSDPPDKNDKTMINGNSKSSSSIPESVSPDVTNSAKSSESSTIASVNNSTEDSHSAISSNTKTISDANSDKNPSSPLNNCVNSNSTAVQPSSRDSVNSPEPNNSNLSHANSNSQNSLDKNQGSLHKSLGGSSDGAVFPGSASKSEAQNRTTFDNVLKDDSLQSFGNDNSCNNKEKNKNSKTPNTNAKKNDLDQQNTQKKFSSADKTKKRNNDTSQLVKTQNKKNKKSGKPVTEDEMHFEELEPDNMDDLDESEFLLDGDFNTDNIDAVVENIDDSSLEPKFTHPEILKKQSLEHDSQDESQKQVGKPIPKDDDNTLDASKIENVSIDIAPTASPKEKKPTDDETDKQLCTDDGTELEDPLSVEVDKNRTEAISNKGDSSTMNKNEVESETSSENTDTISKDEQATDTANSDTESLESNSSKVEDSKNSKEDFEAEKTIQEIFEKNDPPFKQKTLSKPKSKSITKESSKYYLEALNFLQKEEDVLPNMPPKPLAPSEEIPSSPPPSGSLTVLESSKDTKAKRVSCRPLSRGSSIDDDLSSCAVSPSSELQIDVPTESSKRTGASKRSFDHVSDDDQTSLNDTKKARVAKKRARSMKIRTPTRKICEVIEDDISTSTLSADESPSIRPPEDPTYIDPEEVEKAALHEKALLESGSPKLKRIKRKDLEGLVIQLFMDKLLYEHELGHQRDLCKRLEATLEANRKKAAQFHKEVDDLKKVTSRLQSEHLARKNQIVAPVRVKRSVGIQATPTIINKGIATINTNPGTFKTLSPSFSKKQTKAPTLPKNQVSDHVSISQKPVSVVSSSSQTISESVQAKASNSLATLKSVSQVRSVSTQSKSTNVEASTMNTATLTTPTQLLMVNPQQLIVQQPQQNNISPSLVPVQSFVRAPLVPQSPVLLQQALTKQSNNIAKTTPALSSSAVIDLTLEDDGGKNSKVLNSQKAMVSIPRGASTLTSSSAAQFVTLPIKSSAQQSSSVNQLLLLPTSSGQQTATLVVPSMGNVNQTLTSPTLRNSAPTSFRGGPSVVSPGTTIVPVVKPRISATPPINSRVVGVQGTPASMLSKSQHPAPLPRAPPQQSLGITKRLPPKPVLKLSHKDSSIILSWNMAKSGEHESIASYQLYAYQEGNEPPTSLLWKRVGSVKALDLPMACTLTQFMPGHIYHFGVRAVDIRNRIGPFSDPRSIRLGK